MLAEEGEMNNRAYPSLTALLGLLAIAGYQNRDKIAEVLKNLGGGAQNAGDRTAEQGGKESGQTGLGGLLGGISAGTLLNGGLTELLEKFNQAGQQDTADSWVGGGPNKDVAPADLKSVLGPDMLQALAQATGMSEDELLARLSRELPAAVDQYTPGGRIAAA
jgi:uncharacterized protein YidB (DUF937 family)